MLPVYRHNYVGPGRPDEQQGWKEGSTMCCQDGDEAIWQLLYETASWPAGAGGSFLGLLRWLPDELPTPAAELKIQVVVIQAGKAA